MPFSLKMKHFLQQLLGEIFLPTALVILTNTLLL